MLVPLFSTFRAHHSFWLVSNTDVMVSKDSIKATKVNKKSALSLLPVLSLI